MEPNTLYKTFSSPLRRSRNSNTTTSRHIRIIPHFNIKFQAKCCQPNVTSCITRTYDRNACKYFSAGSNEKWPLFHQKRPLLKSKVIVYASCSAASRISRAMGICCGQRASAALKSVFSKPALTCAGIDANVCLARSLSP